VYGSYIVKRTQIYLDEDQDARLRRRAAAVGVTKSTLIRQAVDALLDGPAGDPILLARFRAALEEVERQPVSLPDGREYVEDLRRRDRVRQEELERRRRA
jgi:predicted DNA-binding protein